MAMFMSRIKTHLRSPVKRGRTIPIDSYQLRGLRLGIKTYAVFEEKEGNAMADKSHKRNRLTPWYVGLIVILAAVIFVGYRMWASGCGISPGLEFLVLAIMPAVYVVLMYLTLTSQE
jgi:hypothetical protein